MIVVIHRAEGVLLLSQKSQQSLLLVRMDKCGCGATGWELDLIDVGVGGDSVTVILSRTRLLLNQTNWLRSQQSDAVGYGGGG